MAGNILVLIEHQRGELTDISFEMLGTGRKIASALGGKLIAFLMGSGVSALTSQLGASDCVLVLDNPELTMPFTGDMALVVQEIVKQKDISLILSGNTNLSMGLGTRLAALLKWSFVNFCTGVKTGGGNLTLTSQLFGGKILNDVRLPEDKGIVSIYPGCFPVADGQIDGTPEVETLDIPIPAGKIKFNRFIEPELGDVDITKQDILISVGRGIQSEDNLELAEELAEALGGAVSASRPVVDQGWLPMTRQVGKSGMIVKPSLYLALGISGAPEHIEGMQGAKTIIAVNTDPQAPIFNIAQYGVCEDLFEIVPALTDAIKERKG